MIISKLTLATGGPDISEWNFENSPMEHKKNLNLQSAMHLMAFFIEDLNCVVEIALKLC